MKHFSNILAICAAIFLTSSGVTKEKQTLSKKEFLSAMRNAAFGSCDPKSQPGLQMRRAEFEPWLLEEFNATEDAKSEFNCALFLSCLSKSDFNQLFVRKLRRINDLTGIRAIRLLRQLNYHQARIKDPAILKFARSDDFSVLEQMAEYCVRTEYAPCIVNLQEQANQFSHLLESASAQAKLKMLRKHGIKSAL